MSNQLKLLRHKETNEVFVSMNCILALETAKFVVNGITGIANDIMQNDDENETLKSQWMPLLGIADGLSMAITRAEAEFGETQ